MVDVPAATGVLQKGISVFENIGIVESKVGGQIYTTSERQFW
jgi:hypothetical protein